MKKIIFTTVGVLSFSLALAQTDDFFDIQKHLEKKNKKPVTFPPRPIIKSLKAQYSTFFFVQALTKLSHVLSNGNKVYLLPQGNMPCMVPDMHQFNMPVIFNDSLPTTMPNVWLKPYRIIPE